MIWLPGLIMNILRHIVDNGNCTGAPPKNHLGRVASVLSYRRHPRDHPPPAFKPASKSHKHRLEQSVKNSARARILQTFSKEEEISLRTSEVRMISSTLTLSKLERRRVKSWDKVSLKAFIFSLFFSISPRNFSKDVRNRSWAASNDMMEWPEQWWSDQRNQHFSIVIKGETATDSKTYAGTKSGFDSVN